MQLLPLDSSANALRNMTAEQLRYLGSHHVVYLKAGMDEGRLTITLHGAEGSPLLAFDTIEEAVELIAEQGFSFAMVH